MRTRLKEKLFWSWAESTWPQKYSQWTTGSPSTSHSNRRTTDIPHTVTPQRKIRGCDWSKSRHVTFTKTH